MWRRITNFTIFLRNTGLKKIGVLSTNLLKIKEQSPEIFTLISNSSPSPNKADTSIAGAKRFKEAISNLELLVASQIQVSAKTEINVPIFSDLQNPEIKKAINNLIAKNYMKLFLSLSITDPEKKENTDRYAHAFLNFLQNQIVIETKIHENAVGMKFAKCCNEKTLDALEIKTMQDFYGTEKFAAISLAVINLLSLRND